MTAKNLSAFLKTAKQYARQGTSQETSLLFLLKELEPLEKVWGKEYASWADFLNTERLCSGHRFKGFVKASKTFNKTGMDKFGVSACILMAVQPARIRTKILKEATAWHKEHQIPLTGQRVQAILIQVAPERAPKKSKSDNKALRAHVKRLEALLAAKGHTVPGVSKVGVVAASAEFIRARQQLQKLVTVKNDKELVLLAMKKAAITGGKASKPAKKKRRAA